MAQPSPLTKYCGHIFSRETHSQRREFQVRASETCEEQCTAASAFEYDDGLCGNRVAMANRVYAFVCFRF
jgi:hypothetical protein